MSETDLSIKLNTIDYKINELTRIVKEIDRKVTNIANVGCAYTKN